VQDDRTGALGCGCALLPGLILGVIIYGVVGFGTASAPPPASPPTDGSMQVALSEPYLSEVISQMLRQEAETEWRVNVQPGEVVQLQGQVAVTVFGRELSAPVGMKLGVGVEAGRLRLTLLEAQLPSGSDASSISALVNPLLVQADRQLDAEVARFLGNDWALVGVRSTDAELILLVSRGGAS